MSKLEIEFEKMDDGVTGIAVPRLTFDEIVDYFINEFGIGRKEAVDLLFIIGYNILRNPEM